MGWGVDKGSSGNTQQESGINNEGWMNGQICLFSSAGWWSSIVLAALGTLLIWAPLPVTRTDLKVKREREREEKTESCRVRSARGFVCRTLEQWVGIKTSWFILTLSSSCFCKMERRSVTERGIRDGTQALRTWECVQPALPAQPGCSVCTWTVSVYKTWASHSGFLALSLIE